MAASNSTALAEILGIPSSSSSSARPSAVASPLPDPAPLAFTTNTTNATTNTTSTTTSNAIATPSEAKDLLQNLTTSSQSVGDYFKAKLNAKAAHGEERQARLTSIRDDDEDGRAGLGLGLGLGLDGGSSRILPPPDGLDEESVRGGIGASSLSMFTTMFMSCQQQHPMTNAREENTSTASVQIVVSHDASDHDDNPKKKSEKMRAKDERRRKKEERRRKRAEAGKVRVDGVAVDVPKKKKHREPEAPDGRLEDSHPFGADGREAITAKKRKKDKKSSKHRGLEE